MYKLKLFVIFTAVDLVKVSAAHIGGKQSSLSKKKTSALPLNNQTREDASAFPAGICLGYNAA